MTSRNTRSRTSTKSPTVSRERFDKAIADIYAERAALAEMRENTVTRKSFDRAISDIRRLRAQLAEAYTAGAAAVLNSEVFNEYVPASTRRNLRPGRFAARARRSNQG